MIVSIFEELNEPAGLVQSLAPYNNLVTIMAETENLKYLLEWDSQGQWDTMLGQTKKSMKVLTLNQEVNQTYEIEVLAEDFKTS